MSGTRNIPQAVNADRIHAFNAGSKSCAKGEATSTVAQSMNDKLREGCAKLVAEWRSNAQRLSKGIMPMEMNIEREETLDECSEQLEALLSATGSAESRLAGRREEK